MTKLHNFSWLFNHWKCQCSSENHNHPKRTEVYNILFECGFRLKVLKVLHVLNLKKERNQREVCEQHQCLPINLGKFAKFIAEKQDATFKMLWWNSNACKCWVPHDNTIDQNWNCFLFLSHANFHCFDEQQINLIKREANPRLQMAFIKVCQWQKYFWIGIDLKKVGCG